MGRGRAAVGLVAVVVAAALLVSGGSGADPRTPRGLPGVPAPFLGTAVVGDGGLTAAIDSYGDVVDLRAPGPAGQALIDNPSDRQEAGTVPADTGIVPRVRVGGSPTLPLWRADSVSQRYLPGSNVVVTVARFPAARVVVREAASGEQLALDVRVRGRPAAAVDVGVNLIGGARCRRDGARLGLGLVCGVKRRHLRRDADETIAAAARGDRRWLRGARPLGPGAPRWAARMYRRSLLVLRALTDRRTGAVAAGARDGWAYVWPRDAAAAALAFAAAGYRPEARRVTRFLLGVSLEEAARFNGDGSPVPGRAAQGDASGWVAAAAEAVGGTERVDRTLSPTDAVPWRGLADYQENGTGDFLADAIASGERPDRLAAVFGTGGGLTREAGGRGGLDSAAAWAVRPFPRPPLFDAVRRTLLRLADNAGRYGLTPGAGWAGGEDPWTAPATWTAWSLAALGERRPALRLLAGLRRAATPAGVLPERVDARTGVPRSTTPLAWSHAFAILALRELWPAR